MLFCVNKDIYFMYNIIQVIKHIKAHIDQRLSYAIKLT